MGAGSISQWMRELKEKFMKSNNLKELKTKFPNNILLNEKLSKYSWFNLGGPAEVFSNQK